MFNIGWLAAQTKVANQPCWPFSSKTGRIVSPHIMPSVSTSGHNSRPFQKPENPIRSHLDRSSYRLNHRAPGGYGLSSTFLITANRADL